MLTEHGLVVVDVKPRHHVTKAEVAFVLAWTRAVVELRGWRYEVSSEPPQVELENVRFLAGYRRDWLFDPRLLDALRDADLDGMPLGAVTEILSGWPPPLVRSGLLHLLWRQVFVTDLSRPLSPGHMLRMAA